jgi:hypothetical protein
MLTFFTTAKPFHGHSGTIQRNALQSWTLLHPDAEVILFGDDDGAAEAARDLGLRHEPRVDRSQYGTKRLDAMFARAQALARHDVLCYINCDIILLDDFCSALAVVKSAHPEFLMVGRRWDAEIWEPYYVTRVNWQSKLRKTAVERGKQRTPEWVDYFVFTRGLYGTEMPPFVVGRVHWDHWLVWKALDLKHPVVDVSASVLAVHQNHDYGYHPLGKRGVWHDEESARNHQLAGGWQHLRTIADATQILYPARLRPNAKRFLADAQRNLIQIGRFIQFDLWHPFMFSLLHVTRPLRSALRLRSVAVSSVPATRRPLK